MQNKKSVFSFLLLISISSVALSHGTMEIPVNRILGCYNEGAENPKTAACKEAKKIGGPQAAYDWNAISQNPDGDDHQRKVPNGMLCSGGNSHYRGYDLGRADWNASNIVPDSRGNFEFVYRASAPHATNYFKFYVTKNGWNKEATLNWDDLEEFAVVKGTPPLINGRYKMTVALPKNKTGQHIIYNVWKRSDSEEAFYSCSDVNFSGDSGTPPVVPPTNPWKDQGAIVAHENLPTNSMVTLRIFDAFGRDMEKYTVALDATNGLDANWPYELGVKVNSQSGSIRIGVIKQSGHNVTIVPEKSATFNHLYLNNSYTGYTYNIDIKKGSDGVTPPTVSEEWKESVIYKIGQIVSYQGRKYSCLQAHTAYVGANWNPQKERALWKEI